MKKAEALHNEIGRFLGSVPIDSTYSVHDQCTLVHEADIDKYLRSVLILTSRFRVILVYI